MENTSFEIEPRREVALMYDWILEADIYRLDKAARDAAGVQERRALEAKRGDWPVKAGEEA